MSEIADLVAFGDTHFGCKLALCPPEGVVLDGGVEYHPSNAQRVLWSWWTEFWGEWVPHVTGGRPFAVVHLGDATDGRHHGSTTQISQNLSDQKAIAELALKPIVEACEGRFYMIRGTEAHTGPSGENEEDLARALHAIPDELGQHSRNEMWLRLKDKSIHFAHAIGVSGSPYAGTTLTREYVNMVVEAGRQGLPPPDAVVRGHCHRFGHQRFSQRDGYAYSVTTPSWQLKTPFAYRTVSGRTSMPESGGIVFIRGDEDFYTREKVWRMDRPKEVVA
jgi:hypothetical protein